MKRSTFCFLLPALLVTSALPTHSRLIKLSSPGVISFAPAMTFPTGSYPSGIASGDFNNDGIPDLAFVSSTEGGIGVVLGKGDGTFGRTIDSPATYAPSLVAVGKFDGRNLDAVVDDVDYGNALAVLGAGSGYFPRSTFIDENGGFVGGFAVGDFNGDHKDDLALTDLAGQVWVYVGNGHGTFQTAKTFSSGGSYPKPVVVGDFNGDGKLDLAILNTATGTSGGNVAVLPGNGDGTFGSPLLFQLPYLYPFTPRAIAIGDFNGDKKLDLAVAISNFDSNRSSYVLVLLGKGDGTLRKGVLTNAGPNPYDIGIADFNADGNADIVVANGPCHPSCGNPGSISVLVGNGDGTFQPPASFATNAEQPEQLTIADFNLDGKPDVATVNGATSNVSVLLNTTIPPLSERLSIAPAHSR